MITVFFTLLSLDIILNKHYIYIYKSINENHWQCSLHFNVLPMSCVNFAPFCNRITNLDFPPNIIHLEEPKKSKQYALCIILIPTSVSFQTWKGLINFSMTLSREKLKWADNDDLWKSSRIFTVKSLSSIISTMKVIFPRLKTHAWPTFSLCFAPRHHVLTEEKTEKFSLKCPPSLLLLHLDAQVRSDWKKIKIQRFSRELKHCAEWWW